MSVVDCAQSLHTTKPLLFVRPHELQNRIVEEHTTLVGQWSPSSQLCEASDLSRDEVSDAAKKGAVWHVKKNSQSKPRRIRNIDQVASDGDKLFINYNREVLSQETEAPLLISDQINYSVWYKPSGMLSQGTRWSDHTTITFKSLEVCGKKCLLVHRLDRAARGLILIAHTRNAQKALCKLFENCQIHKLYKAQVHGLVQQALPWTIDSPVDGKKARTVVLEASSIEGESVGDSITAIKVAIETGRKHQIRSHMARVGHAVVGDRLFDPSREHQSDLQLAAYELHFDCPFTGKPLHFILSDAQLNF